MKTEKKHPSKFRGPALPLFLLFVLLFSGCREIEPSNLLLFEILISAVGSFLSAMILWTMVLAVVGLLLGGLFHFIFQEMGLYRGRWGAAKLCRVLTFIAMAGVFALSFGTIGFFEGIYRGSANALTQGEIPQQLYPPISGMGADLVAAVYLVSLPENPGGNPSPGIVQQISWERIDAYRQGEWELDIPYFCTAVKR